MKKYIKTNYSPLQLFAIYLKKYCKDDTAYSMFKKYIRERPQIKKTYYINNNDIFKHVGDFQMFARKQYGVFIGDQVYDNWYDDFLLKYVYDENIY